MQSIKKGKRGVEDDKNLTGLLKSIENLEDEIHIENTKMNGPAKKRKPRKLKARKQRNKFKSRIKELKKQYRQLERKRGLAISMIESENDKQQQIDELKERLAGLEASLGKRRLKSSEESSSEGFMNTDYLTGALGLGTLGVGTAAAINNNNTVSRKVGMARQKLQNSGMIESLLTRDIGMLKKIIHELGTCNFRVETVRGNVVYGLERWITDDYEAKFNIQYGRRFVSSSAEESRDSKDDEASPDDDERRRRRKHKHRHRH